MKREDLPSRFEDLPVSEQERVRRTGEQMGRFVFSYSAAIVIAPPPGTTTGRVNNGSGFVLNLTGSHERTFYEEDEIQSS